MKATSTRNYVLEASSWSSIAALVTLSTNAGDLRFKASAIETTGPSVEGISLSVEKPGVFIVDVNVPKKDAKFEFMESGLVMNKPVNIMCVHSWRDNHTSVDGTVVFNPAHKVSVSHVVASRDCRVKYTYAHGESQNTTLESCYDTGKNTWNFALARKFECSDVLKGTYNSSSKLLGLEWTRDSNNPDTKFLERFANTFKVSACIDMEKLNQRPKLMIEHSWIFDLF
ncbi:outer envelope pore protein 24B, chloroplastic-like [Carex rostrata]